MLNVLWVRIVGLNLTIDNIARLMQQIKQPRVTLLFEFIVPLNLDLPGRCWVDIVSHHSELSVSNLLLDLVPRLFTSFQFVELVHCHL